MYRGTHTLLVIVMFMSKRNGGPIHDEIRRDPVHPSSGDACSEGLFSVTVVIYNINNRHRYGSHTENALYIFYFMSRGARQVELPPTVPHPPPPIPDLDFI